MLILCLSADLTAVKWGSYSLMTRKYSLVPQFLADICMAWGSTRRPSSL